MISIKSSFANAKLHPFSKQLTLYCPLLLLLYMLQDRVAFNDRRAPVNVDHNLPSFVCGLRVITCKTCLTLLSCLAY